MSDLEMRRQIMDAHRRDALRRAEEWAEAIAQVDALIAEQAERER